MAKICILDGFTSNPGDLSWDEICKLGECTVYDRTSPEQLAERAKDAEIVLTNKVVLGLKEIGKLPKLKYIGVLATGYNVVDLKAATERGIIVTNIPAYSTDSVAQMVFAHILNITHHVAEYAAEARAGKWSQCADFCYCNSPIMELAGKTMGIVGLGHTGMATAKIALAFGMKVMALTSKTPESLPKGIEPAPFDRLLTEADILSLHCPLTDNTRHFINRDTLCRMKKTAILINTGRGPLVNEADLAEALNNGTITAAGVDVLSTEPPAADNPLLSARNCYVTPHIAWATKEARSRLLQIAAENIRQFLAGERILNRIN